ncbi:hypothetical protein [Flavobacterium dankookense]|uniref:Uncharacterized protein n=1 Tax=Flavobacterium dankookense TaxID=706186 RepID=A0A4R6QHE3_9FLAO|nr:hypothetical protein [Flavobacterium dankookense]TDP61906.1 hypothetical protein BC748_0015 [Flavobacterium dankookense]
MKEIELRREVLISMQRALWGMIYPEIRAISVGYEGTQKLIVNCYLDRKPNEDDYENIAVVTAEVISDINFMEIEENCIYSLEPISKLDNLMSWVYVRKEN